MRSQFNRQFTTLLRVRAFGEKHSDLFPPSSLSGKMFGIIAEAITALSNNAGSQAAGLALAREGTTAKAEARQALREWVVDISRTARSIGRDHPEILAKFRLPYDVSDRALISVARGSRRTRRRWSLCSWSMNCLPRLYKSSKVPSHASRMPSKTMRISGAFKLRRQLQSATQWKRPWTPCTVSTEWCPIRSRRIPSYSANGMRLAGSRPHAARRVLTLQLRPQLLSLLRNLVRSPS